MFGIMLLLPIFASLVAGIFGRGIGIKGTNAVVLISLFISTLLALVLGYEVILGGSSVSLRLGSWFDTGSNGMIDWAFVLDPLGAWLTGTVLVISFLVHIFATSYMSADPSPQRFMCLLVAFTASMVLLVTGDSLGILFLGWELIGITSFLLIGYWWDRASACNAAVQALIINRVGDCSFTLALMLLLTTAGTLDLSTLVLWMNFLLGSTLDDSWLIGVSWIGVFLVIAAFGKSAQFLLHTWLPRSMDGPTPVSALLHAATLVAGGTYLLLRCSVIVNTSTTALMIAAVIGTITAIFAASTALFQSDAKRIIAYSTCSQFGYLTASIGLGQTNSTLFHLASHSGFKALLFITAGGVIHATTDQQDIRKLGGLITSLPFTYCGMLIGSLSLIATPYLSGFYSKDFILELAAAQWTLPSMWMWILGSVVAGLTACYSVRLLSYIYLGTPTGPRKTYEMAHEQPMGIVLPIVALSLLAISFGYFARDAAIGMGITSGIIPLLNSHSIHLGSMSQAPIVAEFGLSSMSKNLPLICTLIGVILGVVYYVKGHTLIHVTSNLHLKSLLPFKGQGTGTLRNYRTIIVEGLTNFWWIDAMYARLLSWPGFTIGLFCSKTIDRGIIELLGPAGLTMNFISIRSLEYLARNQAISMLPSPRPLQKDINSLGSLNWAHKEEDSFKNQPLREEKYPNPAQWTGNTLPDYSSYLVVFALVILSAGVLYTGPLQGNDFLLLSLGLLTFTTIFNKA